MRIRVELKSTFHLLRGCRTIQWVPLTASKKKDAKETAHFKRVLVITETVNIVVNDFDAKKYACCIRAFIVTELVVSGTQCNCLTTKVHQEF